jgi:hypothetical protein
MVFQSTDDFPVTQLQPVEYRAYIKYIEWVQGIQDWTKYVLKNIFILPQI